MNIRKSQPIEKHNLTKAEQLQLSKMRADEKEIENEAKKAIAQHRNVIKELAKR